MLNAPHVVGWTWNASIAYAEDLKMSIMEKRNWTICKGQKADLQRCGKSAFWKKSINPEKQTVTAITA